jgi:hypothetical protein
MQIPSLQAYMFAGGKRDMNGERIILTLKIKIQMSKFKR